MKKNQISLFRIISMLLLLSQYSFIQSSTAAAYTIYPYYNYTTNPSQPIYTGTFIQFDGINVVTRDGQIVPLVFGDLGNFFQNLTNAAKNNSSILVSIGNNVDNNFIQFRNDDSSSAIATYMISAPKNKNYIAYIEWHAKTTNGFAAGAINIYDKASIAGNTSFTIQLMGGQSLLKILPFIYSTEYRIYDIYMAVAPKTMTVGGLNVDINTTTKYYSYATPSDGPLFMFQPNSCQDVNSNNGCTNCSLNTKFAIDGISVTLPSLPSTDAWNRPIYVRIHVGQALSVTPPLVIPTIDSNSSTINLNGTKLFRIELSTDNQTWTSIPLNAGSNEYKCFHTSDNYYYNLDQLQKIHWFDTKSDPKSSNRVYARINQMFIFEVISSMPLNSGEHAFSVKP